MAWQLVEEVLDHAPGDLTPAEMLALVVIAEYCKGGSRECSKSTEDLARRMRIKVNSVRDVLERLAKHKADVRVPIGEDKNGNPVYTHRRQVPRFRLPKFPPPEGCSCRSCRPKGEVVTAPSVAEGEVLTAPSPERVGQDLTFTPEGAAFTAPFAAEGAVLTPEGAVRTAPLPSSVRKKEEEEDPSPAAPSHSPEAWELICGLPWPDGQRPNMAKARELAARVHTAVTEDGYTLAELDAHLRGRLPMATKNAVTYLLRALDGGELPIPGLGPEITASAKSPGVDFDAEFAAWYQVYPLHKAQDEARVAYEKARLGKQVRGRTKRKPVSAEVLLNGAQRYAAETRRLGTPKDKIAHGATWLNGSRWTDEDASPSRPAPAQINGPVFEGPR